MSSTSTKTSTSTKFPISNLPLPPPSHLLTHNLTPDPLTPSPAHFLSSVLRTTPSIQRRARLLAPDAHFSYVAPCPLPFPFEIAPPEPPEVVEDKAAYIETWLAQREAVHPVAGAGQRGALRVYVPSNNQKDGEYPRELVGLSERCVSDCLPHLDVGNALRTLGTPALAPDVDADAATAPGDLDASAQELVDVLGGHAVLMNADPPPEGPGSETAPTPFAPWSLRYSGHQFGVWAGQLGDGRAMSVHVTPHPADPDVTYELQLKGAGRTPFSRSADGLAVLRSSIREYLCSEAMHALHIPTTRSLALVSLPSLPVQRERTESACIFTRVAPSFLRIGNLEAFNPPADMFFLGGGQQPANMEGLRRMGEWVARRVLRLPGVDWEGGGPWGKELVMEVARRNARMVAGWQAYGFMHGVINTDNVSVLGLTIDYGPYAFMDVFDSHHICNHSDGEGRYAYQYQPNMIIYACRALLTALSPLIGAELETSRAVSQGWADNASSEQISAWRTAALDAVKVEMETAIQEITGAEYGRILRARLGLRRQEGSDQTQLVQPLLSIMESWKMDFHATFRRLAYFRPAMVRARDTDGSGDALEGFVKELLGGVSETGPMYDAGRATEEWLVWLDKYARRIESERDEWAIGAGLDSEGEVDAAREKAARSANPRFVLRQWVLEEVIKKVEGDHESGKRILGKVMQMACNPFEAWGAERESAPTNELDAETREERRLCGVGERKMLGFQCSCSS
ncbi:UPF0061-domain-containing protein [Coniophora puteana RWD-64-598 SS2]|uniref:Selenoprotein O n=1 Tax=Coniophora puteana (strain RWD-64-598) TaxID=741705 RepID=A0A5M3MY68_CONPW|nr:UPF0061-domain-containing protein [Coniophora puteana RWD-64-598 SS2]EIW84072.1 UPF0061-domain-containing protein [Coniophora puteana RWD-64-598 SS2]